MAMLDGKVAFVTGAGSGIGRATAIRLAGEGASSGGGGLSRWARRAGVRGEGGTALALTCDVTKAEQVRGAIERTVAAFGRLDIVVANAGINGMWAPIDELTPEEWD